MTAAQARALTLAHRRNLAALTSVVGRQVRSITVAADLAAIEDWWLAGAGQRVELVVTAGHRAAVTLAARYLRAHADASGATVDPLPARLDVERMRGSLFVSSVGAFLDNLRVSQSQPAAARVMTSRLVASAHRLVLAGERDTVTGTFLAGR
ncbi:MAG TPA: hypothetical protein VFC00_30030 [Micromonosporaceae bacterium]|nr:hypothetical protein [Micromonosporaceae bacterium]